MSNNIDLRLPNITETTPDGQMKQMQSYMHQLVQELNWALNAIDGAVAGNASSVVLSKRSKQGEDISPEEALNTFNAIKALIIKSADIVEAYEDTLRQSFNGAYLAISDFGTYTETKNASIEQNSKGVNEVYSSVQMITNNERTGSLDRVENEVRNTNAYIKRGLLGYHQRLGKEVYGVAVGQTDGEGNYNKHAWFIGEGLCLFDDVGNEVAYISQRRLNITDAVFRGTVDFGGYRADTTDGLAFEWIE